MTGNKNKTYLFRADDADVILIEKKFSESGLSSKSEFFRQMILDGNIITADSETLDKLLKLFGNISNNVNQIALVANRSGNVYKEDLGQIEKELDEIWLQLSYIRSKIQRIKRSSM